MEDYAGEEMVAGVVSKPGQVAGVVERGCCGGFDLEGDQALGVELGDHVELVAAVVLAEVVEAAAVFAGARLCPQLSDDKGLEQPP